MTSRSKGSNQLLSAAIEYAERGWPVFPLKTKDKAPITSRGFLDATTDRNIILNWWQLFPESNIGLPTGVVFDVLDIDGLQSVPALQEILGSDYRHDGPVASTGRGKHLFFRSEADGRNRAGLLGGKLDYRGLGGYVVGAPSIHPSGRSYQWEPGRGPDLVLPDAPEPLREVILKDKPKEAPLLKAIDFSSPRLHGEEFEGVLSRGAERQITRPDILWVAEQLGMNTSAHAKGGIANCPFHNDPGPSLVLYSKDNSFHCFGCEAHGFSNQLIRGYDMHGREFMK